MCYCHSVRKVGLLSSCITFFILANKTILFQLRFTKFKWSPVHVLCVLILTHTRVNWGKATCNIDCIACCSLLDARGSTQPLCRPCDTGILRWPFLCQSAVLSAGQHSAYCTPYILRTSFQLPGHLSFNGFPLKAKLRQLE